MLQNGPDPLDKALGAAVRLRRKSLRLSQTTLAETIGVTFQQVQKYEQGTNRVSFSMMTRIARALGCRASELIADLDTPEPARGFDISPDLLAQRDAVELLESYGQIRSQPLRQAVLDLARKLAAVE